jgi:hypothetical protein
MQVYHTAQRLYAKPEIHQDNNKASDHSSLMMEAACTSETSVDNYFTRQYIPEDNSELHTCRHENLKSHNNKAVYMQKDFLAL